MLSDCCLFISTKNSVIYNVSDNIIEITYGEEDNQTDFQW